MLGVPALQGERRMGEIGIAVGGVGGPQQSGIGQCGAPTGPKHLQFKGVTFSTKAYTISGVTRDSVGVALGLCSVKLFNSRTYVLVAEMVSDVTGVFSFPATAGPYFIVAWGSTGVVAGVTLDTLTGS